VRKFSLVDGHRIHPITSVKHGHPREKIFSLHLWLKLGMLWFTVVLIGFAGGYILFPYGLPLFLSAVLIAGLVVLLLAPKLLR